MSGYDPTEKDENEEFQKCVRKTVDALNKMTEALKQVTEAQLNMARLAAVQSLIRKGHDPEEAIEAIRLCSIEAAATGHRECRVIKRTLAYLKSNAPPSP